jgi:membrane protein DedA with SNARE-associated domain/rhodanese-related sulfurtransferase
MNALNSFLHEYGNLVVFGASLLEQSGLPLPATPVYVAAGVAIGAGEMHGPTVLALAVAGSLLGDLFWYFLGRWRGHQVLRFLCRLSLEPDSCVRDTEERFQRYGVRSLVIAKFLPGLGTVIRPLAAVAGVGVGAFLFYTGLGTVLYIGLFMALGYVFSDQADQLLPRVASTGHVLLGVLIAGFSLYALYKLYKRRQFLQRLPTTRLSAETLKEKMDSGLSLVIVDLRTPLQIKAFPYSIPGALQIPLQALERAYTKLPSERDIILFCNCPNEVSSAKAALFLQRKGFANAWALTGGIDEWRERTYPLEALSSNLISPPSLN